jgi:glycosyltransferase involved in cell wall biosynthesis
VVRWAEGVEHHVAVPSPGRVATASGAVTDTLALAAMDAAGAGLHRVDMRRSPAHPANAVAVAHLHRLARAVGAEVVHGHSSIGGTLGRVTARLTGAAAVYTPNGLASGRGALAVERVLGAWTDRLVAASASEAALAVERRLVPPERVVTIANGIDLDPPAQTQDPLAQIQDLRARFGLCATTPLVGTVARLVEQKAPVDFVAVCASVAAVRRDTHFLLVGMGPLGPDVDTAVVSAGIEDRFHRVEHLPGAAAVLGQLQVFVLTSRFEGAPYTPLEAMRSGVAVVLSDVVGNRDVVEAGRSGFLRPFGDTAGMAADVLRLLDDEKLRQSITAAATEHLHAAFDVRTMGAKLASLYQQLRA